MVKTSKAWEYFIDNGDTANCKHCTKVMKLSTKCKTTSSLRTHLRTMHPDLYTEMMRAEDLRNPLSGLLDNDSDSDVDEPVEPGTSRDRVGGDGAPKTPSFCRKRQKSGGIEPPPAKSPRVGRRPEWSRDHVEQIRLETMITRWVCETNQPFAVVDHEAFVRLIKHATYGQYHKLSARTLSNSRVPAMFQFIKGKVNGFIEDDKPNLDGVGFTTDIWTSDTNAAFMSLTLHYIDARFKLKRFLVRLVAFPEQHTGENMASKLDVLIAKLGLRAGLNSWCTTDGGSNVKNAVTIADHIQTGIWCVDHRIHLIISDVWKKCPLWSALSSKVSRLVCHFSHSSKASTKLRNVAQRLGLSRTKLCQRVATRWNSDLRQLQSVRDLWRALEELALDDSSNTISNLLPSAQEKLNIGAMINLLEHFATLSECVSSDKNVTITEVVPRLYRILAILMNLSRNSPSPLMGEVAEFMLRELESRFPSCGATQIEFAMAHFLDPRYKGAVLRKLGESYDIARDAVVAGMIALVDDVGSTDGSSPSSSDSPPPLDPDPEDPNFDPVDACLQEVYGPRPTSRSGSSSLMIQATMELELYTNKKDGVADKDRNVLSWWQDNSRRLPLLARLARKILAIPASSATSERVFSTAGEICSERRTNLSVTNIEMLVYMKENMRELNNHDIVWPGFG